MDKPIIYKFFKDFPNDEKKANRSVVFLPQASLQHS